MRQGHEAPFLLGIVQAVEDEERVCLLRVDADDGHVLVDPGRQDKGWDKAAPADGRAGYVQESVIRLNCDVGEVVCLLLVYEGEAFFGELVVVDIETADQGDPVVGVGVFATSRGRAAADLWSYPASADGF